VPGSLVSSPGNAQGLLRSEPGPTRDLEAALGRPFLGLAIPAKAPAPEIRLPPSHPIPQRLIAEFHPEDPPNLLAQPFVNPTKTFLRPVSATGCARQALTSGPSLRPAHRPSSTRIGSCAWRLRNVRSHRRMVLPSGWKVPWSKSIEGQVRCGSVPTPRGSIGPSPKEDDWCFEGDSALLYGTEPGTDARPFRSGGYSLSSCLLPAIQFTGIQPAPPHLPEPILY
jgi:hypothetical protein